MRPRRVLLFLLCAVFVVSAGAGEPEKTPPPSVTPGQRRPLLALSEALIATSVLQFFNIRVAGFSWAKPTAEVVRGNFTEPWDWEDADGFKVNQLGHPYQGSLYFNAGRANGFGFYESFLFSTLGSALWETFGEGQHASINDFITTAAAAAPLGEMTHRLFLEAQTLGLPRGAAFLVSPMDGFNFLISGRTGREVKGRGENLYELSFFTGAGWSAVRAREDTARAKELFSFSGPSGNLGLRAVYGDPFGTAGTVPYEHFELSAFFGMDIINYIDIRVISDAYLLSFVPVDTEKDALSTGLSLHFDFMSLGDIHIHDSTIDQSSTALDWSAKYLRRFREDLFLTLKLHGGFTFLGVSDYYSPFTEDTSLKNYGLGTNVKCYIDLEHQNRGRFSLALAHYWIRTLPSVTAIRRPPGGSAGDAFWLYIDAAYSRRISGRFSAGIALSLAREWGRTAEFPGTRKGAATARTFIMWSR